MVFHHLGQIQPLDILLQMHETMSKTLINSVFVLLVESENKYVSAANQEALSLPEPHFENCWATKC